MQNTFTCNVAKNASGRLHLFLPNRKKHELPEGEHVVIIDGERWVLAFRKIAVNAGFPEDAAKKTNHFAAKLAEWYPQAAKKGEKPKGLKVSFTLQGGVWHLADASPKAPVKTTTKPKTQRTHAPSTTQLSLFA